MSPDSFGRRFDRALSAAYQEALATKRIDQEVTLEQFESVLLRDWLESHGYLPVEGTGKLTSHLRDQDRCVETSSSEIAEAFPPEGRHE